MLSATDRFFEVLFPRLSAVQRTAVQQQDQAVLVEAGAGTGKTMTLTSRYVWLLLDPAAPCTVDQLVMVTFTRKAAAEMADRVRSLLRAAAGQPEAERRARTALAELDRAWIGTLHSLCGRLLKEYALPAGLDPQFAVLEEHAAAQLQRAVLLERIAAWPRQDGLAVDFALVYSEAVWYRSADYANVAEFCTAFLKLYEQVRTRGQGRFEEESLLGTQNDDGLAAITGFLDRMEELIDSIELKPGRKGDYIQWLARCEEELPRLRQLAQEHDWQAMARSVRQFQKDTTRQGGFIAELVELRRHIKKESLENLLLPAIASAAAVTLRVALAHLLADYDHTYRQEKARRGVLDFADLELQTLTLLTAPEHRWIAQALRRRFQHLLVDEVQDTNPVQFALLEALARTPQAPDGGWLFLVGDPKQSIYHFREADLKAFEDFRLRIAHADPLRLVDNYRSRAAILDFTNGLLADAEVRQADYRREKKPDDLLKLPPLFTSDAALQPRQTFPETSGPYLELVAHWDPALVPQQSLWGVLCKSWADYAALAALLHLQGCIARQEPVSLQKGSPETRPLDWGDIAVLVRAADAFRPFAAVCKVLGIPYYIAGGRGFFTAPEVRDVVQFCRLLAHPEDDLACAAVLRSPIGGVSLEGLLTLARSQGSDVLDEDSRRPAALTRQTLWAQVSRAETLPGLAAADRAACTALVELSQALQRSLLVQPLSAVLDQLYERTRLPLIALSQRDGLRRLANLHKLQELAAGFPFSGGSALREFAEAMEAYEEREVRISEAAVDAPGSGALALLTIHGAKGLEWPVVVLPELERGIPARSERWSFHRDHGLGLTVDLAGDGTGQVTLPLKQINDLESAHRSAEDLRLLYVALTRAEERLILTGSLKPPNKNAKNPAPVAKGWLKRICDWAGADLPGSPPEPGLITIAGIAVTVLDWQALLKAGPPPSPSADRESDGGLPANWTEIRDRLLQPAPVVNRTPSLVPVAALTAYARCPALHHWRQVVRYPAPGSLDGAKESLPRRIRGSALHRVLQELQHATPEELTAQFSTLLPQALLEAGGQVTEAALADLHALAESYLGHPLMGEIRTAPQVWMEQELIWWLPLSAERRIYLRGTPDLILERQDGSFLIVDYKTRTLRDTEPHEPEAAEVLQLTAYATGVARWRGCALDAVTTLVLAPRPDGVIAEVSLNPDEAGLMEAVAAYAQSMEQAPDPEAPGWYAIAESCVYCDYRAVCPGYRQHAR